jgi:hypothetical protein
VNALRGILAELAGLFVEARLFALGIALWLVVAYALSTGDALDPTTRGYVLFAGLALVLVGGIVRGARKR